MNIKHAYCDFTSRVQSYFSSETCNFIFTSGSVNRFEINGEFVYLWQDAEGNASYSFDLSSQEYLTTSITKLGNALSSHFRVNIEAVNNKGESFKKVNSAAVGLNKAISESQRHDSFAAYSKEQSVAQFDLIPNMNQNLPSNQVLVPQAYPQQNRFNQEQLYGDIINLSVYQLRHAQQTYYIYMNKLPIVHKEVYKPVAKCAFFIEKGFNIRNKYIPSEHLTKGGVTYTLSNSFILSFIFAMAKNDITQAMKILVWLVNSVNTLVKLPYALVLQSENDTCMKLFYEEIIMPLFNNFNCEKITSDVLNEKSLSKQLDEKIIYNFHNITIPTVLDRPTKEFTNRLIHKDDYKLNNKIVTTVANILITSTSKYIPMIAKDVECLVVDVESTLDHFCRIKNISTNCYVFARYIADDLDNFVSIARSIDLCKLNNTCNFNFYKDDDNTNILDGDVELLEVFNASIKNRDESFFELLKIQAAKLYRTLIDDFAKNRVNRKNLIDYFTILFGEDIYKKNQNKKLIDDLRKLSQTNEPFNSDKARNIHGIVYYYI
jgi:hypothetical protein